MPKTRDPRIYNRNWLVAAYESMSLDELCRETGYSPLTIQNKLLQYGVLLREEDYEAAKKRQTKCTGCVVNPKLHDLEYMKHAAKSGKKNIDIAAELRCSPATVQKWMKRHDITRRDNWVGVSSPSPVLRPIRWRVSEDLAKALKLQTTHGETKFR